MFSFGSAFRGSFGKPALVVVVTCEVCGERFEVLRG
jgi:hypothetical protein